MASIKINGKKFEYEKLHLVKEVVSSMNRDVAEELLLKTKEITDKNNLKLYLCWGTLLGAVRDKNFIKGDNDVDVYVDNEKKLLLLIPELYKHNIKLCRVVRGRCYTFMYRDSCHIDIDILRPFKFSFFKLLCFNLGNFAVPKKYLRKTQEISFCGTTFYCPQNPEKLLRFWYGDTWRTPCPGINFHYEIYLSIYYKKCRRFVKRIILTIFNTGYFHRLLTYGD